VLDLLASPTIWSRRCSEVSDTYAAPCTDSGQRETFDVCVLGVALLASVVEQDSNVSSGFQDIHPLGLVERDGGALSFVLGLLKEVGSETIPAANGAGDDDSKKDGGVGQANGALAMEKRVMTGYLCLLLGALVKGCERNRVFVRTAMPDKSLTAVADVLDEFLVFHHDLGVVSECVDDMYVSIIESLRNEWRGCCNGENVGRHKDVEIEDEARNCNGREPPVVDDVDHEAWFEATGAGDVGQERNHNMVFRCEEHDDLVAQVVDETEWFGDGME
jgi:hypothetical protein